MLDFKRKLEHLQLNNQLPLKVAHVFRYLFESYEETLRNQGISTHFVPELFDTWLSLVLEQLKNPFNFEPYHSKSVSPFNYHRFGLDVLGRLLDRERSHVAGHENLLEIQAHLKNRENVVLLANHQSEADPHIIDLLLEDYGQWPEDIIYVAGERVLRDPISVPFSMGKNLLCIYSKKHIENPPERRDEKQSHNQKTMGVMVELLKEGGKCIYVAPSGGRDRPNAQGEFEVAAFDSQSLEMFHLMSQRAKTSTHFYPLALLTYEIVPPPKTVEVELGELRFANYAPAALACGKKIDMGTSNKSEDKSVKRQQRAKDIHQSVVKDYEFLKNKLHGVPGV